MNKNTVLSCPFSLSDTSARIMWEVTGSCNLKCSHCLYYGKKGNSQDLTFNQMIGILNSIVEDGQIKSIWLSGGEPLLRPDIFDLAYEISRQGMIPSLSSNGTLITPLIVQKLYDSGIRYVHVSIDGTTAPVHDKLRCTPGAFNAVMRGVTYLKESRIRIGVSFMVTWESINQVPEMISMAVYKGIDVLSFYLIAPIGRGASINTNREKELMDTLERILTPYNNINTLKIEYFRTVSRHQRNSRECGLMECKGQHFYTITNSGFLASCPWLTASDFSIPSVNLLETSFSDAKNTIQNRMESFLQSRKEFFAKVCTKCRHSKNCGYGCPAVSSPSIIDPLCRYM